MKTNINETDLQLLSEQLACPSGEKGLEVAQLMSQTNLGMILSGILYLKLRNNDTVLELGHGDGTHVTKMHAMAKDINYYGLDISPLMVDISNENNKENNNTSFNLYDGEHIGFKDNFFNKIVTVNTLYFYRNPIVLLKDMFRVLKPKGRCVIVFADKDFMETLPFTQYGFTLYDKAEFFELISKTEFKVEAFDLKKEVVKNKIGEFVERKYYVAELTKDFQILN